MISLKMQTETIDSLSNLFSIICCRFIESPEKAEKEIRKFTTFENHMMGLVNMELRISIEENLENNLKQYQQGREKWIKDTKIKIGLN
jgi:hypothetical protein